MRVRLALLLVGLIYYFCYAFDPNKENNLVNYWGQNSYGASGGDMRLWQKPLSEYCQDGESEDVIALAFLHVFNSATRSLPQMDLSNQCSPSKAFPGTSLRHCPKTGAGIKLCQSKGKAIILSLGGAAGAYGFSNDAEAKDFAHMIWNLFLGGSSAARPFDDAVLDGVDLDIEGGSSLGYPVFIAELRSLFATDPHKPYYISAAPQCPFPDAYLGATLQTAWVDMVFVQFYNNYCGNQAYGTFNFNFEQWDTWAKTTSINKNVKIYLGVPASKTATNAGYVTPERLREIVDTIRCRYSSFGGVMLWDMSQLYGSIDEVGTDYSTATAQGLKRSKQVVCGGQDQNTTLSSSTAPVPPGATTISKPVPISSPNSLPHTPSSSLSLQSSSSSLSLPPSSSPLSLPQQPPPSPPSPPPSSEPSPLPPLPPPTPTEAPPSQLAPESPPLQAESMCPIEGGEFQAPWPSANYICDGYKFAICLYGRWIFQSCAPGTYCTPHGCDFIDGPVKSCREIEQASNTGPAGSMRIQMSQAIDPQEKPFESKSQYPFIIPEVLNDKIIDGGTDINDEYEPFLIDFIQLDASREFVSTAIKNDENNATAFRTQVRIRTNGDAISRLWWVSFYVKPGQVVHLTSRGTVHQRGLEVFVASDPSQEAEYSMVVRFVIEGVKTSLPNSSDGSDDNPTIEGG
ncbi:Chitinase 1 [Mortierella sp. AD094]|nr:Chitinase 1 [Mortierella sp. AD094]